MFVAQSIKPQARTLAESRGIVCVEVNYDELRGKKVDDWTLFN
jgi:RecB family endonuclease NucS